MKRFVNYACMLCLIGSLSAVGCSGDDGEKDPKEEMEDVNKKKGTLKLMITDAPVDDDGIESVFVTITAVELDSQRVDLQGKMTLNVAALQDGQTALLLQEEIEAKQYQKMTLIMDYETDASGNGPGCYVMSSGNRKHDLKNGSDNKIAINLDPTLGLIEENGTREVVLDLDLRKAIQYDEDGVDGDNYNFHSELSSSLRIVDGNENFKISGEFSDALKVSGDKVIVYAYAKNQFDVNTEVESQVFFNNAVTSTEVKEDGTFSLHFLEKGDYELHFVSYTNNNEGKYTAKGMVSTDIIGGIDILDIILDSDVAVQVNALAVVPF
jgi:hypothetical protein